MGRFLRNSKHIIIGGACGVVLGWALTRLYDNLKAKHDSEHYITAFAHIYLPEGMKDEETAKKYQEVIDRNFENIQEEIRKLEENN